MLKGTDSYKCSEVLNVNGSEYVYYSLKKAEQNGLTSISKLPKCLKVLQENLLRNEDGLTVTKEDLQGCSEWTQQAKSTKEVSFYPSRVIMQDFTGVPAIVDLAVMRDTVKKLGGDPLRINPKIPVDLVIDHSVTVDHYGDNKAFKENVKYEFFRNKERYEFLKWGQNTFQNFRVVPPGTGIVHQVNLEYLAQVVCKNDQNNDSQTVIYCDSLVGTDSHTTMINGLSVFGWGVGGIEAEAALLGEPVSLIIPEVIGVKLEGKLKEGVTATDLVLKMTEILRRKGVVGKFVEFYGDGLKNLSLADRATIANMAPEYGATMGFFPIDEQTIKYLRLTNRDAKHITLVESYAKEQGLWRLEGEEPIFTDKITVNLDSVSASLAGPKRPQDRVDLELVSSTFYNHLQDSFNVSTEDLNISAPVEGTDFSLSQGDIVIAAITSCTNTSNPSVMIGAGLLARKAREKGLQVKPWVKTSLAPGSKVVTDYLAESGLNSDLDHLGFNLVGYGCTTCIGNSGPLKEVISQAISEKNLVAVSVLSGNRNFEGRISPDVKANYLASPPMVVAYALAGNIKIDLSQEPIGQDHNGQNVYLKDLWPTNFEINQIIEKTLKAEMFEKRYSAVFEGTDEWKKINVTKAETYSWNKNSTYIQPPPFFTNMQVELEPISDINKAKILAILPDSTTTDHISPAGHIAHNSPAGIYLQKKGVLPQEFNSYGSRRGNDNVMTRGTFANIRIKNEILMGEEGGYTLFKDKKYSIYDAAMEYAKTKTPLVVIAGKEYGTGSSRDWAAKGTNLLGVKAVIAESFERIHRSNLVGMGVLPLEFLDDTRNTLKLTGREEITIRGLQELTPGQKVDCEISFPHGKKKTISLKLRIDTRSELEYYRNGGILHFVIRKNLNKSQ